MSLCEENVWALPHRDREVLYTGTETNILGMTEHFKCLCPDMLKQTALALLLSMSSRSER